MSFFGSNGMVKDLSTALKWYAKSAMQMTDASAMYDYAILLLKVSVLFQHSVWREHTYHRCFGLVLFTDVRNHFKAKKQN